MFSASACSVSHTPSEIRCKSHHTLIAVREVPIMAMADVAAYLWKGFKVMFYIVPMSELTLGEGDDVPPYLLKYGIPMFFVFIFVEFVIQEAMRALGYNVGGSHGKGAKGGPASYRLNELVACTLVGSFQQIGLLVSASTSDAAASHHHTTPTLLRSLATTLPLTYSRIRSLARPPAHQPTPPLSLRRPTHLPPQLFELVGLNFGGCECHHRPQRTNDSASLNQPPPPLTTPPAYQLPPLLTTPPAYQLPPTLTTSPACTDFQRGDDLFLVLR